MKVTEIKILNQPQAIQYFIEKMDIKQLGAILDDNKTYQDFEKNIFISKLQQVFETFGNFGDTHLIAVEGNCNVCDVTKKGYTFIGNKSNNYMSIIFDIENNSINNLYECRELTNKQPDLEHNE